MSFWAVAVRPWRNSVSFFSNDGWVELRLANPRHDVRHRAPSREEQARCGRCMCRARKRSATNFVARSLRRESGAGVPQPSFEKTRGYRESARSTRGASQLVFVLFRQIQ